MGTRGFQNPTQRDTFNMVCPISEKTERALKQKKPGPLQTRPIILALPLGLEPRTYGLTVRCSNQLS